MNTPESASAAKLNITTATTAGDTQLSLTRELLEQGNQTNILLSQILEQLKSLNAVSNALLQKTSTGIRVQEPVIVEVDGVVAVVGH